MTILYLPELPEYSPSNPEKIAVHVSNSTRDKKVTQFEAEGEREEEENLKER
jgi:hypothetical protein